MFQPVSLFIGLRYSRSKSRTGFISFITFFSTVGILLGVASLITVVSVMNGFEGELKKRILGIVPHVIVSQDLSDKSRESFKAWPALREQLLQQQHVEQVTPFLSSEALIQSSTNLQGVLLQGIVPEFEQNNIISKHMISGSLNSLSEHPYGIIIGYSLANKLKVSRQDTVRLVLPNQTIFTPMGRMPVQRKFVVSGIFDVGSQVDDAMVYVHSKYGAKLLRRKGDGIDQLRLYLDDAFNAKQVVGVLTTSQKTHPINKLTFTTWNDSQGALFSAVNMEKKMMWIMLSLIIAVAAFNIVSALVMVVVEKQGEIGILQTLGLSRIGIVKIFITQGMINGLWGTILGSILGVLVAMNLNEILAIFGLNILGGGYAVQALPVQLEPINVVVIIFSALAMSFIATLYPAFQASKTQPAEVLRNE